MDALTLLAQVPGTLTPEEVPYLNMENYVAFTDWQHALLIHTLVIGFAAHAAGIFYFILTRHRTAGRYSSASTISVVVMVLRRTAAVPAVRELRRGLRLERRPRPVGADLR